MSQRRRNISETGMDRMGMFTVLMTTPALLSTGPGKPMPTEATWARSTPLSSTRPRAIPARVSPICSMEVKRRGAFFTATIW